MQDDERSRLSIPRLNRRRFLELGAAATAGTIAVGSLPLAAGMSRPRRRRGLDLIPDRNGLLDLPYGFHYRLLADESTIYSDGTPRPGDADGMGAFPGPHNTTILCVNHELSVGEPPIVPSVNDDYDPASSGGTSVMQIGPNRELLQAWVSSSGTNRNCAGGVTPWNTWITVEENVSVNRDYTHGWAFEVDPYAPLYGGTPRQIRLDKLGRFLKEAATVDPESRAVYQTEDRTDSFYYRFMPAGRPLPSGYGDYATAAGVLQALVIERLPNANAARPGDTFYPEWAEVPDPDGTPTPTRYQSYTDDKGKPVEPTRFYRGEGSWWSDHEQAVYFDCTGGGSSGHLGQIWRYTPATNALTLVYESHDASVLDHPDNLFVLPWGDLMICEDGSGSDYLRVLKQSGEIIDFARTTVSELAGACWSSSPNTLFVNIQSPSITLAIWGPWPKLV